MQAVGMSDLTANESDKVHYANNDEIQGTPIQTFYAGQSIFITGGTGFMGKILIEKLLRSCPRISKIYVLIRSKKNNKATNRLEEIFESPLFDRVREETPNFRDKVVPVVQVGELDEEGLGLTEHDRDLVIREVSIVFHLMANVRFNEELKVATKINVNATCAVLDLAKRMPNLKSLIHVSTVFTNCFAKHIDERFYEYPIDAKEFVTLMPESTIDERISRATSLWPNTYTFTKAIAEILLRDGSENLPVGIFRPSIVSSTAREPLAGWVENYNGPVGVLLLFSKGILRFIPSDSDYLLNMVPADITINTLIAAAWDVFNQPHRRGDKMLIYNNASTNDAPLTYDMFFNHARLNSRKYPTKSCYWLPTLTLVKNKILYTVYITFGHLLPALFIEIFQICTGARQRIWKQYGIIHKRLNLFCYFTTHDWIYTDDNVHAMWRCMSRNDQVLFNFNMKGFDWPKYLEDQFKGVRLYALKDDFSTLEASRIKWKRLYWMHQATKIVLITIVFWFAWELFAYIFL